MERAREVHRRFDRANDDSFRGFVMGCFDQSTRKIILVLTLMSVPLLTALPSGFAAELGADPPAFTPDSNAARSAIPEIFKWNLSPLFSSDEAWDTARMKLLKDIPALEAYDGRLAEPAALP